MTVPVGIFESKTVARAYVRELKNKLVARHSKFLARHKAVLLSDSEMEAMLSLFLGHPRYLELTVGWKGGIAMLQGVERHKYDSYKSYDHDYEYFFCVHIGGGVWVQVSHNDAIAYHDALMDEKGQDRWQKHLVQVCMEEGIKEQKDEVKWDSEKGMHAHHQGKTMAKLRSDWLDHHGLTCGDIEIAFDRVAIFPHLLHDYPRFVDEALFEDWKVYHRSEAAFAVMSAEAHRQEHSKGRADAT